MLVSISDINTGDAASKDLFNTRFAAIVNVLNGNIDSTNISNNSITYSKLNLADLDIPVAKIALTPGTSSGATRDQGSAKIGTLLIQWGESDIVSTGTTVTFNQAYATNPTVVLTPKNATTMTSWLTAKSTTTFAASCTSGTIPTEWIAIGKSA